ncbi:hypothetical protein DPMN_085851 [Dreissena polymorpha]|uniref:ZP domain-containing protein n=1 Tax=Dreissena polymorpha TaxID=45954 RepID=A0A9D4BKN5_DREPO|nr:hypothetical protein DPMN_085851 [Dreissena polymorpha]
MSDYNVGRSFRNFLVGETLLLSLVNALLPTPLQFENNAHSFRLTVDTPAAIPWINPYYMDAIVFFNNVEVGACDLYRGQSYVLSDEILSRVSVNIINGHCQLNIFRASCEDRYIAVKLTGTSHVINASLIVDGCDSKPLDPTVNVEQHEYDVATFSLLENNSDDVTVKPSQVAYFTAQHNTSVRTVTTVPYHTSTGGKITVSKRALFSSVITIVAKRWYHFRAFFDRF